MTAIVFYFQVHQPFRLGHYTFFDIGRNSNYFDDVQNERIVRRVAEKCYLPMNALIQRLIDRMDGRFRCAFSISGTALEQFERWSPETLASFQALAATGCVEFLAETSHHSLASLIPVPENDDGTPGEGEFERQVCAHAAYIERLFGRKPETFRNTELVVDNATARRVERLGFKSILGEGADHLLGWRSPHRVYRPEHCERIKLLLRSYKLSDDIAFRFSNRGWSEWPLKTERFVEWLHQLSHDETFVGLFMDYETFGEHQWADTGIFEFMERLPEEALRSGRFQFRTPAEVAAEHDPEARLDIPHPVSWADAERDLTAWLGNPMQDAAFKSLYDLEPILNELPHQYRETWRKLTTSDHVYYMCTKWFSDGDVHKYFSPYASPHDAFISFMNVLDDLARQVDPAARPVLSQSS